MAMTQKTRLQRSLSHLQDTMRHMRHAPIEIQVQVETSSYTYYGMARATCAPSSKSIKPPKRTGTECSVAAVKRAI